MQRLLILRRCYLSMITTWNQTIRKLDSLIAYVNELKSKGAQIDGIGTQMHIGLNTSQAGIENMFRKLAATGLKVQSIRIRHTGEFE